MPHPPFKIVALPTMSRPATWLVLGFPLRAAMQG